MPTIDELLDLDGAVARTSEGYRWDLLDQTNDVIGELHPADGAVTITNRSDGAPKRRLSGLVLKPDEAVDVNTVVHRVRPWFLLADQEWPLGVFLFSDASTLVRTEGDDVSGTMSDEGLILAQPIPRSFSYAAGTLVSAALLEVCELAGFDDAAIDTTQAVIGSPVLWMPDQQNTWAKVLSALCELAGFYDWYFDTSTGLLTLRAPDDLNLVTPVVTYRAGGQIAAGSIVRSNDLLRAPNRYVVIDTSATAAGVVATFDIPESAPHSFVNRGYYVTETIKVPGIGSAAAALVLAQSKSQTDVKAYETVAFASPADPRHQTFTPISFLEEVFVEVDWSLRLQSGPAVMRHTARRVYL